MSIFDIYFSRITNERMKILKPRRISQDPELKEEKILNTKSFFKKLKQAGFINYDCNFQSFY